MSRRLGIALAAAATAWGGAASAGGLQRPNGVSARGVGLGGAWAAWVDDATALLFNPAAMAYAEPSATVGGELVVNPRTYTPTLADGSSGPAQRATTTQPLPSLGVLGRFAYDGHPSRFTLGLGVWNTFGGKVAFPRTGAAALDAIQDAAVEVTAGTALYLSDRLSVGAAVRFGIGLFSAQTTMLPFDARLDASGVGAAMAWGLLYRPTDAWRIGVSWRSPLTIATTGSGTVVFPQGPMTENVAFEQRWPQIGTLALGWRPAPAVRLAAQVDYTQWSRVDQLQIALPGSGGALDQTYKVAWRDTWTVRAGGEYRLGPAVAVRAGAYRDGNAVPDRTLERQYVDSAKLGVAGGASASVAGWRIDGAVDVVLPGTRTVDDNAAAVPPSWPDLKNKAPGTYQSALYTLELALSHPL